MKFHGKISEERYDLIIPALKELAPALPDLFAEGLTREYNYVAEQLGFPGASDFTLSVSLRKEVLSRLKEEGREELEYERDEDPYGKRILQYRELLKFLDEFEEEI